MLLHICCGVCAAGAAAALLKEGHEVAGYFYNPNIHPQDEYLRRLETARKTANHLGFRLEEGLYDTAAWEGAVAGLAGEPEGGRRCQACYRLRLEQTYRVMRSRGFDAFTTTLTISPHKKAQIINSIGVEIGGENFLARDFKKKDGFKQAVERARRWELYRQDYCGCKYSRGGTGK